MRHVAALSLLITALLHPSLAHLPIPKPNDSLSSFYEYADAVMKDDKDDVIKKFSAVDRGCVKEKLKLPASASKMLSSHFGKPTAFCGFYLCLDAKKDAISIIVDKFMDMKDNPPPNLKIECVKLGLSTLEPDAKILIGFDPKSAKKDECKADESTLELEKSLEKFESAVGTVNEVSCGTVSTNDVKKAFLRFVIVKFGGLDEELKKLGRSEIKEMIEKKSIEACNCLVGKI